jgi:hypothetical protein
MMFRRSQSRRRVVWYSMLLLDPSDVACLDVKVKLLPFRPGETLQAPVIFRKSEYEVCKAVIPYALAAFTPLPPPPPGDISGIYFC